MNVLQGEASILLLQANLLLEAIHCLPKVQRDAVVLALLAEKLAEAFQVSRVMEYFLESPEGEEGKGSEHSGITSLSVLYVYTCMYGCACVYVHVCTRVYMFFLLWPRWDLCFAFNDH